MRGKAGNQVESDRPLHTIRMWAGVTIFSAPSWQTIYKSDKFRSYSLWIIWVTIIWVIQKWVICTHYYSDSTKKEAVAPYAVDTCDPNRHPASDIHHNYEYINEGNGCRQTPDMLLTHDPNRHPVIFITVTPNYEYEPSPTPFFISCCNLEWPHSLKVCH